MLPPAETKLPVSLRLKSPPTPGKPSGSSRPEIFGILWILLIVATLVSVCIGAVPISLAELTGIISSKLGSAPFYKYEEQQELVFWVIRLPRTVLGILVGAGLGMAGAALQGLFRNSLADPGLIGISSGASLFAALFILFHATYLTSLSGLFGNYTLSIMAFAGACCTTLILFRLSQVGGQSMITTMLLLGVAINAFSGSVIGMLSYLASDEQLRNLTFWNLGSLGGASWNTVFTLAPFIILALTALPRLARPLNLLSLGESQAVHLGVDLKSVKRQVILFTTLAVGASVAVAGIIGFIGLIVPHIIRRIAGPDHRVVLLGSALGGAALLTLADTLSRTLVAPAELPIGILTGLVGTPVFVYLLLKEKTSSQ